MGCGGVRANTHLCNSRKPLSQDGMGDVVNRCRIGRDTRELIEIVAPLSGHTIRVLQIILVERVDVLGVTAGDV